MARPKQNLPRALRQPTTPTVPHAGSRSRRQRGAAIATIGAITTLAIIAGITLVRDSSSQAATERRVDHEVIQLLAGLPQHQNTLGSPTSPITLEIFGDLKDPDSRSWFLKDLPAIIRDYVRPGTLKLEYHSYKTNTRIPQEFVKEQTAALAAGAQNKLWNYIDTFYHEQGNEFATYVTENYLDNIAHQIRGLNIAQWHTDRHTGRREEQTTAEDQTARALNLHVTPSFRIGRTGGTVHNYAGHAVIKYGEQHPIALPEAQDIGKAIKELGVNR
jgi:protein-disulfide isomerase